MSDLGNFFREKREEQGKSVKDVSRATLISKIAIEAIEKGDFSSLPSYVHCYGFVKKYAEYLGYSYDEVKSLFEAECKKEDFLSEETEEPTVEYSAAEVKRKFPFFATIVVLLIIGGVLAYLFIPLSTQKKVDMSGNNSAVVTDNNQAAVNNSQLYEGKEVSMDNVSSENATVKKAANNELDNQTQTNKSMNETSKNSTNKEITPYDITRELNKENKVTEKSYEVSLDFSDTCWVHINIDDERELDFIAEKGLTKTISFSEFFLIDIGNAAAITISHDGDVYRRLGGYREPVKNLRFVMDNGTLKYSKVTN